MENLYNELDYNNNYALSQVDILKNIYPNEMIWFRKIDKHFFFIVVNVRKRKIVTTLNKVMKGGTPISNHEFDEFISELQDSLYENIHQVQDKENLCVSIERFLEENEELSDEVSFDIFNENERFYDSPIWDWYGKKIQIFFQKMQTRNFL